ncbi:MULTISPECIES: hypothetical protein [Xanthomonas]|uniref:hypothetical protein n=1 Tax=Xanthomonas TaxID=338 RepID=UPI001ADB0E3A|nr:MULTISPECIES: hypothetical protein [unclassified Xanthomonas]MBO9873954.1 hypothetical protein [Xanthomonas sp. D-93]WNH43832.1 hypothetical protein PG878_15070 [Xanthomonas sp. A6251]
MSQSHDEEGQSTGKSPKKFKVDIGSSLSRDHGTDGRLGDILSKTLSHLDPTTSVGRALKHANGLPGAMWRQQMMHGFGNSEATKLFESSIFGPGRLVEQLGRTVAFNSIFASEARRSFEGNLGDVASIVSQARMHVRDLHEEFTAKVPRIGQSLRSIDESFATTTRMLSHFGESLQLAGRIAKTAEFQSWRDSVSVEDIKALAEAALTDLEKVDVQHADDASVSVEQSDAGEKTTLLVLWFVWLTTSVRETFSNPKQRQEFLSRVLAVLMFIYSDISADRDQAELSSEIHELREAMSSGKEQQKSDMARLTDAIYAQLALQAASQSFEVSAQKAPMRDEPDGALIGELHQGDEVQVLQAKGKWRYVHAASDEGDVFEGWVMKKHLRRADY